MEFATPSAVMLNSAGVGLFIILILLLFSFFLIPSLLTVLAKCLVQYSIIFSELSEIVVLQAYPKKTNGNACWVGKKSALRLAIHFG